MRKSNAQKKQTDAPFALCLENLVHMTELIAEHYIYTPNIHSIAQNIPEMLFHAHQLLFTRYAAISRERQ